MNPWLLCKGNFLLVNKGTLVLYFVDCYLTVTHGQRVCKISFAERKFFIVFRKKFLVDASEKKLSELTSQENWFSILVLPIGFL